jgi:RNA polymerase sigma factor (sigma-70 family)
MSDCPRWLAHEFDCYYVEYRCRWAPTSPRPIFNLCFNWVFLAYRKRMSPEEFMSVIYETLESLFQTFDPDKYTGRLPLDKHFVIFFKRKLQGKLSHSLKKISSRGHCAQPEEFPDIMPLEDETRSSEHVESLPEGLTQLDQEERHVIERKFWDGYSFRKIGRELDRDHKTVIRRYDSALAKLRDFFVDATE